MYPTPSDPWTAAYQAPPSMGFSRQEYWSGVPSPSPPEDTAVCQILVKPNAKSSLEGNPQFGLSGFPSIKIKQIQAHNPRSNLQRKNYHESELTEINFGSPTQGLQRARSSNIDKFCVKCLKEGNFVVVQSVSHVQFFATPWTAACQASLSSTVSQSLLKLMSTESVMLSNHLILCCPLSSCLQSFPASGSFQMSQFFASGDQSIGASASVLPMNIQDWFPLGLTALISLLYKELSRVFSSPTIQEHQFFGAQPFFMV